MKRDYKNVCVLFFSGIYDESRISSVLLFINHHGRLYQVGAGVFSRSRGADDNYHEDHIAARHAAGYKLQPGFSHSNTSHVVSDALAREVPGHTELGSGSCRSLLSRMKSG